MKMNICSYCGTVMQLQDPSDPYILSSDSEDLIITFSSDSSVPATGFQFDVTAY